MKKQGIFKSFTLKTFAVLFVGFAVACGSKEEKTDQVADEPQETFEYESEGPAVVTNITLEGNDQMKFNANEFHIPAGETVTLKLVHTGTMAKEAMGHNFVLLAQGTDVTDFALKSAEAKENEYIPKDTDKVLAHTKLLGGGESDTITFSVAEKGTYDFICSFPGHAAMMRGKIVVE